MSNINIELKISSYRHFELSKKNFLINIPDDELPMAISNAEKFIQDHCFRCIYKNNACQKLFDKDGNCYQFSS